MRNWIGLGLLVAVGGACADDGGAVCGDGVCAAGESAAACPYDCAGPACDPAVPTACAGASICVGQQCVSAFERRYAFTVTTGTFPQLDATGQPWDAAGDPPDGLVRLTVGAAPFLTPVEPDTVAPVWNAATAALVPAGATYQVDVLERDSGGDVVAWSCPATPLTAELLRAGVLACASATLAGATVAITVGPE